jgi:hypothetical protein
VKIPVLAIAAASVCGIALGLCAAFAHLSASDRFVYPRFPTAALPILTVSARCEVVSALGKALLIE